MSEDFKDAVKIGCLIIGAIFYLSSIGCVSIFKAWSMAEQAHRDGVLEGRLECEKFHAKEKVKIK